MNPDARTGKPAYEGESCIGIHPCGEPYPVALVTDPVRDGGFHHDRIDTEGLEPVGRGVGMGDHQGLSGFPPV